MYTNSSQKKHWTFDSDEIINLKVKHNQEFINTFGSHLDVRKIKMFKFFFCRHNIFFVDKSATGILS